MKIETVVKAFKKRGKRIHLVGDYNFGVLAALDLEGRLYTIIDGEVINRINLEAIHNDSKGGQYFNPGGDGLWPAPEGTTLGYNYSTGKWQVPPGIRSARYNLEKFTDNSAEITAEIDLINNKGLGVPTIFRRQITLERSNRSFVLLVKESIIYVGLNSLSSSQCLLAPWTLSQFDCGSGSEVIFPGHGNYLAWDLYKESGVDKLRLEGEFYHIPTEGVHRFQIGLAAEVPWIQYIDHSRGLEVKRVAQSIGNSGNYIDISDQPPNVPPDNKGVRYSIYNDSDGFMELEAVGRCPENLLPETELSVIVSTEFTRKKD